MPERENPEPRKDRAQRRGRFQSGNSMVELALMLPWILFLFIGAFDIGSYCYVLISAQNAARVAALNTSSTLVSASDSDAACRYALAEMRSLANVRSLSNCASLPLIVSASSVTGADGQPASAVSVTYQTVRLIPMPFIPGRMTVTRTVQMRVRELS